MLEADHEERMQRARLSLEGLSVGDAFGECFFQLSALPRIDNRDAPDGPWYYTDDTMMAKSIVDTLEVSGRMNQDGLALRFAHRFRQEPDRGYGAGAYQLLSQICAGSDWRTESRSLFGGQGSMGNGGAMRVAPVGAYFADDVERVAAEAALSAEVTHAHPEGRAGAIAVAVGAAMAWRLKDEKDDRRALLEAAHDLTPAGETRDGIASAMELDPATEVHIAAIKLGTGSRVLSSDTVPFALWRASNHLHSFEDALWATAAGLGDVDTTCAMVGGIVALAVGTNGLPTEWLRRREPLEGPA